MDNSDLFGVRQRGKIHDADNDSIFRGSRTIGGGIACVDGFSQLRNDSVIVLHCPPVGAGRGGSMNNSYLPSSGQAFWRCSKRRCPVRQIVFEDRSMPRSHGGGQTVGDALWVFFPQHGRDAAFAKPHRKDGARQTDKLRRGVLGGHTEDCIHVGRLPTEDCIHVGRRRCRNFAYVLPLSSVQNARQEPFVARSPAGCVTVRNAFPHLP